METALMELGVKDGLFAGLFIWLLYKQMTQSELREDKLYNFLDEMKIEFAKLVSAYEKLTDDVNEIKEDMRINKINEKDDGDEDIKR